MCAHDILGGLTGWQIKMKESMYCIHVEGSTSSSVCLYVQIRCVTINQCIQFLRSCWRYLRTAGTKQRFYRSFIGKHCKWSIRQWNVQDSFWLSGLQLLKPLWTALGLPGALQPGASLPLSASQDPGLLSLLQNGSSLQHRLRRGCGVSLIPSKLRHAAIIEIKQLQNISANSADLELITILIWQKAIPLRSLWFLLSPPTHGTCCRVSEGNETYSLSCLVKAYLSDQP